MKFGCVLFKLTLVTDSWVISCEIPLSWVSLNLPDDKWALVPVMAWCHQATSHYLNQCWPRSMSPYSWIKSIPRLQVIYELYIRYIRYFCRDKLWWKQIYFDAFDIVLHFIHWYFHSWLCTDIYEQHYICTCVFLVYQLLSLLILGGHKPLGHPPFHKLKFKIRFIFQQNTIHNTMGMITYTK